MTTQLPQIPSKPPASDGNLGAVLEWCLKKLMQKTDGQLPARVVSVSAKRDRVTVQPLIAMVSTSGTKISRAQLVDLRVLSYGGGGFFVNFPLQKGDLGWIEASDRDTSLFLQSMNEEIPNSKRIHSFEDARFIPDVFSQFSFTPASGAMVIASLDGATRIEMTNGKIKLVAATVEIDATDTLVNSTSSVTINTAAYNVNATGAGSTLTGTTTLPDNTTIGGTAWRGHKHGGVQSGGSNTNGVNP